MMMSSPKIPKTDGGIDTRHFDEPNRFDHSLVGFMTSKMQSTVQLEEQAPSSTKPIPLMGSPILPHNSAFLSILNSLDADLFSSDKSTISTDNWSFMPYSSIDLEPTPIKPDLVHLRQEEELQSGANGETSAARLTKNLMDSSTPTTDTPAIISHGMGKKQQSDGSSNTPNSVGRSRKKDSTTGTKRKRKSKHPVFRSYQKEQFQEQYEALLRFKEEHGHCLVPHMYEADPALSRWVKRQRYQYKLKIAGINESTMTEERVAMLEEVGFVWDSHKLAWQDRLKELRAYKEAYGDCNVPSTYAQNPALATWVKCQRRLYRRLCKGEACNITLERIAILDGLGFDWKRRY